MTRTEDQAEVEELLAPGSLRGRLLAKVMTRAIPLLRGDVAMGDEADRDAVADYVARMRPLFDRIAGMSPQLPGTRVTPTIGGPVPGEWVSTFTSEHDRVVMHVHGGAYSIGSPRTHRGLARGLAHTGKARAYLPEYRLAPEHPFPAAVDDVVAAYRWLVGREGIDPGRVVVSGDSAGGGLALALLLSLRDAGDPLPAGYVGLSPWTDLAFTGDSLVSNNGRDAMFGHVEEGAPGLLASLYYGDTDPTHPLVSPLYADLTGLPPMLVHVGEAEIIRDDSVRLVARAREADVDASLGTFPGLWHVFQAFPIPEAGRSLREIGGFIRRVTEEPA